MGLALRNLIQDDPGLIGYWRLGDDHGGGYLLDQKNSRNRRLGRNNLVNSGGLTTRQSGLLATDSEAKAVRGEGVGAYALNGSFYVATHTNLAAANPSFEGGLITGWDTAGSWFLNGGALLSATSLLARSGSWSGKIVCPGAATLEGGRFVIVPVTNGQNYTASGYVYGDVGGEQVQIGLGASGLGSAQSTALTLVRGWQRIKVSLTASGTGIAQCAIFKASAAGTTPTFYVDNLQVETGLIASPYVDTSDSPLDVAVPFTLEAVFAADGAAPGIGIEGLVELTDLTGLINTKANLYLAGGFLRMNVANTLGALVTAQKDGAYARDSVAHHALSTIDSANLCSVYGDGVVGATTATLSGTTKTTGGYLIAGNFGGAIAGLRGRLQELAIYSRALSAADALAHAQAAGCA